MDPRLSQPDSRVIPGEAPIVFIIDDDASVRESLGPLVEGAGWQAETFASAQEFLARPGARVPSCLVLDIWLPDIDGLELQGRTAADRNELPIVFVAEYGDVPTAVSAMKAGAVDFLTKPYDEGPLLAAIASAIERSRTALQQGAEASELRERLATLTPREREVMTLVATGLLNKQVGGELGISEITVKAHRGKMMRKMKARSLASLLGMATRLGIQPSEANRSATPGLRDRASLPSAPSPRPAAATLHEGIDRYLRRLESAPRL
jgi:FixJ family two-component response regulator